MKKEKRLPDAPGPIGIFDSGYGGLTILDKIRKELPEYDYIYLGDNARTPYGTVRLICNCWIPTVAYLALFAQRWKLWEQ